MIAVNMTNKWFYTFVLGTVFLFTFVSVFAAYSFIPNPGHGGDVVWVEVEGEQMSLQEAIDTDFLFSKSDNFELPLCEIGETLQYNYSGGNEWECVDLEIYEPPFTFILGDKSNTVDYKCQVVDVEPWCGDEDGCRIDMLMVHENANDQARVISQHIYFEDNELSTNDFGGKYVWVRQEGGGDYALYTGTGNNGHRSHFFNPWDWAWAHNYEHTYCDYMSGHGNILNTYEMSFMSHPSVMTRFIIWDN